MTLMRNAIPPQYAETLPEAAENMLAAMQSSALDVSFIMPLFLHTRFSLFDSCYFCADVHSAGLTEKVVHCFSA